MKNTIVFLGAILYQEADESSLKEVVFMRVGKREVGILKLKYYSNYADPQSVLIFEV